MKKKSLHLISAIAVGAIIIAATSYGVWRMNKDIDNAIVSVEQNSNVSDWRTYKNEEFGFELKYPKKYENDDIYRIWDFGVHDMQENYYNGKSWGITKWRTINISENGYEVIIEIAVYSKDKKEEIFKDNFYKLTGKKVLIGNNIEAEKVSSYNSQLFVERGKFFYLILTSFSSGMKENEGATEFNEYQNILKTLKIY